ncbi:MAG: tol-pal system protein YbgF, partial [Deferrisomatales bacterium]
AALETRPKAAPAPAPAATAAPAPAPAPAPTPAAAPAPAPAAAKLSGQALYDQAYALYKQAKYPEARELFATYIQDNPDTNLTDNAYFWIGETYYDQGQFEPAILEYDKAIQKFPKGDKVASALLKQAFAFDAIGDRVDARILLKKILREHASSEQAAIAKKKLELLGE